MAHANITLREDLLRQVEEAAEAEGISTDALAEQAVRRELVRRFWDKNKREAAERRGNMSDQQVDALVARAIADVRSKPRN